MGIVYDDKAVEALLDRSQGQGEEGGDENLLANEYLSQFKVRDLRSKYMYFLYLFVSKGC